MDHSILDSSGQLIDQRKNIFEERGEQIPYTITDYYVWFRLNELKEGNYIYQVTIYDRISKDQITVERPFTIIPDSQGIDDGNYKGEFLETYLNTIKDTLEINQTKIYMITGSEYETTVLGISNDSQTTNFSLNIGEQKILKDYTVLKIDEIYEFNGHRLVNFYLGRK